MKHKPSMTKSML